MEALSELEKLAHDVSGEIAFGVNGWRLAVHPSSGTGRVYPGGLSVAPHYCATCAREDQVGSHDGADPCPHKEALDAIMEAIHAGEIEAEEDWYEVQERRRAAFQGVL